MANFRNTFFLVTSISGVGVVNGRVALGKEEDQQLEAMDGHFVAYLDEGGMVRCGRWFTRSTA